MPKLKLELTQVRKFSSLNLSLTGSTLLVGPNGIGKSTVIEALYYLSYGRSPRTMVDRELISWDELFAKFKLEYGDGQLLERTLKVEREGLVKTNFINGVLVAPIESLGKIHTSLFSPELLNLFTGSPRLRRRYLDMLLATVDLTYAQDLAQYNQVIKQRNQLLSQNGSKSELKVWDEVLASLGQRLIRKRQAVITFMAELINEEYQQLVPPDARQGVRVGYLSTVSDPSRYEAELEQVRNRDYRYRSTTIGPHRDDISFLLSNYPATQASRGEQRSLFLALKQAELKFIDSRKPEHPPILLLDDIFSELDLGRSELVSTLLSRYPSVTTTADLNSLPAKIRDTCAVIDLREIEVTQ